MRGVDVWEEKREPKRFSVKFLNQASVELAICGRLAPACFCFCEGFQLSQKFPFILLPIVPLVIFDIPHKRLNNGAGLNVPSHVDAKLIRRPKVVKDAPIRVLQPVVVNRVAVVVAPVGEDVADVLLHVSPEQVVSELATDIPQVQLLCQGSFHLPRVRKHAAEGGDVLRVGGEDQALVEVEVGADGLRGLVVDDIHGPGALKVCRVLSYRAEANAEQLLLALDINEALIEIGRANEKVVGVVGQ